MAMKNPAIIGHFDGVCADADITNLNGLDITRAVWTALFQSDEYKQGLKHRHYIGFLGHPEDPNCMDFKNACIVMTDCHLDDDGRVRGSFDLVDTPVGRIVKTFIDAGVTFGISVRGAGDIYNNSVEPGTFVFRGFDLVAFPAWEEAIPTFSEVAASTDPDKRARYKRVCAAVETNLNGVTSSAALKIIKDQFPKQSNTYKAVEAAISNKSVSAVNASEVKEALNHQKIEAMVDLYIAAQHRIKVLADENQSLKKQMKQRAISAAKKTEVKDRIVAEQLADLKNTTSLTKQAVGDTQQRLVECQKKLKSTKDKLLAAHKLIDSKNLELEDIRAKHQKISNENKVLASKLDSISKSNLQYRREVNKAQVNSSSRNEDILRLKSDLYKTVAQRDEIRSKVSNLEAKNKKLEQQIAASQKLVADYQDAYAAIYANAVGVSAENISIQSNTSVSELKSLITGNKTFDRQPDNITDVITDMPTVDYADEDTSDIISL